MNRTCRFALLCTALALPAAAQLPSNASLKGTYWVRYLGVIGYPSDLASSFAGTMTFDGIGGFTVSGNGYYYEATTLSLPVSTSGSYAVQSGGTFAINNPFTQNSVNIYGGIGVNGIVVGSSTDSSYLDLFVAIPQSTAATTATLNGTYRVGGLEFANGSLSGMRNPFFNMTADGAGNLGNVTIGGTSMALNDAATTQTSPGATYTMTATGNGTITFPAPVGVSTANQLISGAKYLYVSPDGSFFISGSANGFDMQVGVKAIATGGSAALSGLYFSSGMENDNDYGPNAYQGAVNEIPSVPEEIYHQRVNYDQYQSFDFTFTDSFTPGDNGTSSGSTALFALGANGNYSVQTGAGGLYYLYVEAKVPTYSGTGVFLDPAGVVNAGSSAPFTAQLSPGEVITLYGSGFTTSATPSTASAPLPATVGGVQVTINGTAIPIYYVSSGQINAIVPYTTAISGAFLNIQVNSNGALSNIVQEYIGTTSPGVFAVTHADGTLVTTASPAAVGEILVAYACGLGVVSPATAAGAISPAATITDPVFVSVDDLNFNQTSATVQYQGLAPGGPAGLYQINFTVPKGLSFATAGVNNFQLDILAPDGDENVQAIIPITH